jgi:hypothetical protein
MMGKKVGKVSGKGWTKMEGKRKYWQVKRWANGRQIRTVKMVGSKAGKIGGKNGGKKWREK